MNEMGDMKFTTAGDMMKNDIVLELREWADEQTDDFWAQNDADVLRLAADEIERLREKCDKQAKILQRLAPDKHPGVYFITGEGGDKDINGMPERLYLVPTYGVDFAYAYDRTDRVISSGW